ncbi:site-specific DNA-methyltransferase [Xanthobacter sediminis]|uniref:site-specific DNA-methyltransferase n=1 Tax=Xanthobacter sediminis TaxID=3119926 RepID=UPI0037264368
MTAAVPRLHLIELEKMKKLDVESPETKSADTVSGNVEVLKSLFPDAVTEGKIDFEVLKQLLGGVVDEREEKYGLDWHGKRRARQIALTPSTGTLRPCPEESVDWDTTRNLMIEGDNLEALKLLQKSYAGKVKLIYIDPPYNTGKDFVYPDDFRDSISNYLQLTGQVEGGRKISSNTDASGRFHTDWLNMIYPRLKLASSLLSGDGVIFISIDDTEVARLRIVCDEIFGEENFRADISWQKRYTRSNNTVDFTDVVEHIITYARSDIFSVNLLPRTEEADARYTNPDRDPRGVWKGASFLNPASPSERPNLCYPLVNPKTGSVTKPTTNAWRRSKEAFEQLQSEGRLYWGPHGDQAVPSIKMFLSEARGMTPINLWTHDYAGNTDEGTRDLEQLIPGKVFNNPKPVQLIRRVLEHGTNDDSIVLDFFAGSGTVAQAVMELNAIDSGARRFIAVQLPEPIEDGNFRTISEITKERMRCAGKKVKEANPMFNGDVGFRVFKLASSNIRAWEPDASDIEDSLLKNAEHLVQGRKEQDVLYELLLKLGLDLCVPIETKTMAGKTVHSIGGGTLIVCLADGLTKDVVEELAKGIVEWRKALAPAVDTRVVFKDTGFADDIAKTNMAAILNQAGISDVRSL